ncbi:oxygenase [Mycobacterium sp. 852013-50091_SCH5140682]|uniref:FAD-dependent monooxygenase n=1 Tax=Mycobacterium sp. 852013-50091_SCH5140682 TaxID=1834109 RepID=UPI0007E93AD8|nr:FAD-dependent monooxygenase [Mycobacterium sp. 852013-50091_SCH5140682]OBC08134.1 oxygenase [Mycobacterium sp. 852013-50091_SCH5140682]
MVDTQVLIAGAGPAGLAVACGLLSQGVPVRIVDKAEGPATTSRANFVHARGSEVLDRLGALGELPQQSVRAMQITTYLGDQPVMRVRFGDPGIRSAAPPMVISQAAVEASLRNRLAELGGAVDWSTPLTDLRQDDTAVVVTLGDGTTARAAWLVGCDGAASTTRRRAGIGFPGVQLSERFLLADVRLDWDLDRSGTTGWIHPHGMVGAMPMPDGMWRIIAYDPGLAGDASDDEVLHRLRRLLPERTGHDVQVTESAWLSMFTVHRRLADTYRRGRVLIAGDAAHTHAPFGGQGMLTGLGDAENLAWKLALLAQGVAEQALLDSYEAERRPLATEVLRGTSAVTKVNITQRPVGRFVRDRIAVPVLNLPAVQRWITYQTSQLWVSYRKGPLAERSLPLAHKPRPGDRVPDGTYLAGDGHSERLYPQLRGHWVLVSDTESAACGVVRTHLADRVAILHQPGHPEVFLIRPDGHLGWRGTDPERLDTWLTRVRTTGRVR